MKNVLILFAGLLSFAAKAQNTEGIVTYVETVQFKIDIPEEHKEMLKDMPTSQSFSKVLLFNENETLYKDPDANENSDIEMGHQSEGMNLKMVIKRPENTFYTNLENGKTINSREFFGRNFLVEGETKNSGWKLTGDQKKLLGYVCQKATMQQGEKTVEAWFTTQIPVSAGPSGYGQLPGLILEVNFDTGDHTIIASNIDLKKLPNGAIEKPTKGKKVTQEEFDRIEAEKMKEMEQETGGSGKGMKIIIKN